MLLVACSVHYGRVFPLVALYNAFFALVTLLTVNHSIIRGLKLLHCLELEAPRLFTPEPEDAGMARLRETLGRSQKLSPRSRPAAGFWAVSSPSHSSCGHWQ